MIAQQEKGDGGAPAWTLGPEQGHGNQHEPSGSSAADTRDTSW